MSFGLLPRVDRKKQLIRPGEQRQPEAPKAAPHRRAFLLLTLTPGRVCSPNNWQATNSQNPI